MAKGMNPQAMLKQAQKMQAKIQAVQEEAARETVEATAGGGMVPRPSTATCASRASKSIPRRLTPRTSRCSRT